MPHQLSSLVFRCLLLPCLAAMAALASIDANLKTESAPQGIVSFSFCALGGTCEDILREWNSVHREFAMLSLGVDYLFMLLYPAVLVSGLLMLARRLSAKFRRPTKALVWLVAGAGVADTIENYCLVRLIASGNVEVFALPAALLAVAKFAIVAAALLWLAVGFVLVLRKSDA